MSADIRSQSLDNILRVRVADLQEDLRQTWGVHRKTIQYWELRVSALQDYTKYLESLLNDAGIPFDPAQLRGPKK